MKTKAVRLYGKNDLRLEEFELPEIKDDEILAKVITDSICMSSYKAAYQGPDHKRVPNDVAENPIIIGHEMCGELVQIGSKYNEKFKVGQRFSLQANINHPDLPYAAPGYSFKYVGGNAQYIIIPKEVMDMDCLLLYNGASFFQGSLAEPVSCIIGAYHAMYHTKMGSYEHNMEIKEGGNMAILAGVGPMGLGAIDYAVNQPLKPSKLVVTDINDDRLNRAAEIYTVEWAASHGVELLYVNTGNVENPVEHLLSLTDGKGYDDVFVFAPVKPVIEQGDAILGMDGCLNFFAGPTDKKFSANFNFYNVHYASTHVVGTSGGNTDDMREALSMFSDGILNPASMVTHVGGLDSAAETTLNLPNIPGGKKLIYTGIKMPLTAIEDFEEKGFKELAKICNANNGLWCKEAEDYLLEHSEKL
ncbi:MAG: zinc-binding dehydrogenase [Clostridia bacterium]|nr:zinc-binding dehydrogenase [Clostridia bacterium]MBN2881914.1 zinc-binding dehydrogenase [Clostridia bacterium]